MTSRLQENLCGLRALLQRPDFGLGPESVGAELEASIVDGAGSALPTKEWRPAVRVPFGTGWVHRGIQDLLAEAVAIYPPVLGACGDEDSVQVVALRDRIEHLLPAFPFRYAEHNFYRAAQWGLDADLLWPDPNPPSPVERPVAELVEALLPEAERGLSTLGVELEERTRYLSVIQDRLRAGTTGARWLRRALLRLDPESHRREALQRLTLSYLENVATRRPVHEWPELRP